MDNAGGTLISQGVGTYHVDTLNNSQGKLHSGDALALTGSQVNNQAGQLVSTQDLVLIAAQLNNNGQGTISSQGALDIQSDTVNNRDGGLILGTTRTGVTARAADNTAGRLQSAGAMTLTGLTQLDNTQGRVIANGPLSINALSSRLTRAASALSVLNPNGLMQSGASLVLDALSLNNQGGTLQSQQALSLSVQQDYTHRAGDTVSSNGALTFSVAGVLTNMTDWLLPGDLTLNSAHVNNQGALVGKSLQITTGQLTNRGRIEADAMTLDFDTLDNPNAVMGDNLTLRELAAIAAGSRGHRVIVGTAEDIADDFQQWLEQGGADGFNIMPAVVPEQLDLFVELVIPELRRRGLFREAYEHATLRENLGLQPIR